MIENLLDKKKFPENSMAFNRINGLLVKLFFIVWIGLPLLGIYSLDSAICNLSYLGFKLEESKRNYFQLNIYVKSSPIHTIRFRLDPHN